VARASLLRQTVEQRLAELEAREPAFAALKDQAMHWRGIPNSERQSQELAAKLAKYMEAEITPRALDAIDRLDQLRALADPHAAALSKQLDDLSKGFQP
jgi:DICT domain-containing protein